MASTATGREGGRGAPRERLLSVQRPRLLAQLDASLQIPLTVVTGPAGSGKTVLGAQWVEHANTQAAMAGQTVTWVEPTEHRLLGRCLLTAARVEFDDQVLDDQSTDGHRDADAVASLLLGRADTRPPDIVLIDDAQRLPEEATAFLSTVLARASDQVRLVLLTRQLLALPLVRLRLDGAVVEIGYDDLRFTDHEAAALIRGFAPTVTEEGIAELQGRSQGWAAALALDARTLAERGAHHETIALGSTRTVPQPVLDYLLADQYERLGEDAQAVLLTTCQELEIDDEQAALLSARPDAPHLLADLAAERHLVADRGTDDAGAHRWALHPLLSEWLRRRTAPSGPDWPRVVEAHLRAYRYYVFHGDPLQAVNYARRTGEPGHVVEALQRLAPTLMCRKDGRAVVDALRSLPPSIRFEHPHMLCVDAMICRGQGDTMSATRIANEARSSASGHGVGAVALQPDELGQPGSLHRSMVADLVLMRLWQARFGWARIPAARQDAALVLDCKHGAQVGQDGDIHVVEPEEVRHDSGGLDLVRLSWLLTELAATDMWAGDLALASIHLAEALGAARMVGLDRLIAAGLAHRAVLELVEGSFGSATRTARECLDRASAAGVGHDSYTARAHLVLGYAAFQELQFEQAEVHLGAVGTVPTAFDDPVVEIVGTVLRARLLTERGQVEEARQLLAPPPDIPEPLPAFLVRLRSIIRAQLALLTGDLAAVEAELDTMRGAGRDDEARLFADLVLGLRGDIDAAVDDLTDLLDGALVSDTIGAGVATARLALLLRANDVDRARELLPDLLNRVMPQRRLHLLTTGLLAGRRLENLLHAEAIRPGGHPFAGPALEALRGYRRPYPVTAPTEPRPARAIRQPEVARAEVVTHASSADTMAHAQTPGERSTGPGGTSPSPQSWRTDGRPMVDPYFGIVLTPRERDVLELLAVSGSYEDIAKSLFIAENTVKTHISSIYRKLGVTRRADAVGAARDLGFL